MLIKSAFLKKIFPYAGMVIVVIVVGYFARQNHNTCEQNVVTQTEHQLLDTVRYEGGLLNEYAFNLTQELELLAGEELVQDSFSYRSGKPAQAGFLLLEDSYKDVKSLATSLTMIDAAGRVIDEVPVAGNAGKDISVEVDVAQGLAGQRQGAGRLVKTVSGDLVLAYDQPVFSQGKFLGLLRAVVRLETLQAMLTRERGGDTYSFILDRENRFLSYPETHYLGENLLALLKDNNLSLNESRLAPLLEKMKTGADGYGTCLLFPLDSPHQAEAVVVAFTHVRFGAEVWSLVHVIDYDAVAKPINTNARDNLVFAVFVVLLLCLSGAFFLREERRKNLELQRLYDNLAKNHEALRSTQAMLIQSAKMESVGKLAAGVAHEVKNPLAVILLGVRYIKDHIGPGDEHVPLFLTDIEHAVERADTIIKGLLDFSSTSRVEMQTLNIQEVVEHSLLLTKHLLKEKGIRVTTDFGKYLPLVDVDPNKVEQVCINLVLNAIQAMPSGGELRVNTHRDKSDDGRGWVVVAIEDTGTGMSERVLNELFVPFMTTKRGAGGTGLGLSIVKNIMELHGGRVVLKNINEGHGVQASLWFKI